MASFGENLRRERELRGVDLHEMAEATKISIRFLQALEQDRVDILPGGIFPRAFVRQYGKYLGLDPERLVAEFVFAYGGEPVPARAPSAEVHLDRPRTGRMIAAAALLVAAVVGYRMWARPAAETATAERAAPSATPATFPQDRVYPPPNSPPAAATFSPRPGGFVVALTVRKQSWVEAKVDGASVLNRVLAEGETQRLDARDGVVLSLGNAGGVEYSVNGSASAPLGRDGEVKRNVVITADGVSEAGLPAPIRATPRRRPSPSASPGAEAPTPAPAPSAAPGD